jgi:hypothetical protein
MTRLVKLCSVCITVLVIICTPATAFADDPPHAVKKAAEEGLIKYLTIIQDAELEQFGFKSVDELARATLGEPYKVYTIKPQSLASYSKGERVSSLLSELSLWYFPIEVDGEARTMLAVTFFEEQWQPSEFGGTVLPQSLQSLETHMPSLLENQGIHGEYSVRLVRIFDLQATFLLFQSGDRELVVPLLDFPDQYGVQNDKLYDTEELVPQLAESAQRLMEDEGKLGGGPPTASVPQKDSKRAIYLAILLGVALVALTIGILKVKRPS